MFPATGESVRSSLAAASTALSEIGTRVAMRRGAARIGAQSCVIQPTMSGSQAAEDADSSRPSARRFVWELPAVFLACALAIQTFVVDAGAFAYHIDVADIVGPADEMLRTGEVPLVAPQRAGSDRAGRLNGPLAVWFVALCRSMGEHPRFLTVPSALLVVLALLGLWRVGRAMGGPVAGLVALVLAASSPALALDLRFQFMLGLHVIGVVLALGALHRYAAHRDPWALPWAVLGAVLSLSVHITGWISVFLLLGTMIVLRLPVRRGPVLAAIAAWSLLYGPWAVHQLTHDFEDVREFLAWIGNAASGATGSELSHARLLANVLSAPALFPEAFAEAQGTPLPAASRMAQRVLLGLEAVSFLFALVHLLRGPGSRVVPGLLVAAVTLPYALLPLPRVGLYPFQFIAGTLPRFLLVAWAASRLASRGPRARVLVFALTGALALAQTGFHQAMGTRRQAPVDLWPPAMLLSSPDGLWRVPLEGFEYPRFRGIEDLIAIARDDLGTSSARLTGRAHGPAFAQVQMLTPYFRLEPEAGADAERQVLIGRSDLGECGGNDWRRVGGYCVATYEPVQAIPWQDEAGTRLTFPIQAADETPRLHVSGHLDGARAGLGITLLGPNVSGRSVRPEVTARVYVDGVPLPPVVHRRRRLLFEEQVLRFVLPPRTAKVDVRLSGLEGSVLVDIFAAPAHLLEDAWPAGSVSSAERKTASDPRNGMLGHNAAPAVSPREL